MFKLFISGVSVSAFIYYMYTYHKNLMIYYALKTYKIFDTYVSHEKGDFLDVDYNTSELKVVSKQVNGDKLILINNDEPTISRCIPFFMSIDVTINDNEGYSLILDKSNYNMYVVGNKINYRFIQWYLKYVYDIRIELDDIYKVSIVDKNLNIHRFCKNDILYFYHDRYDILSNK